MEFHDRLFVNNFI